jgi:methyl-accepting chemotaxis protein
MFAIRSLRARLRVVASIGALGILAVAIAGQSALRLARRTSADLVENNAAQRYQMDSDMMHDAMRADVLEALLAGQRKDTTVLDGSRASLKDHGTRFIESLNSAEKTITDSVILASIPALRVDVDKYSAIADSVQQAAIADPVEAQARFVRFGKQFDVVEVGMEQFGDRIQARSKAVETNTDRMFATAEWIIWGCFALFFVAGLFYAWRVAEMLNARIARIVAQVDDLQQHGVEGVSRALGALARGETQQLVHTPIERLHDQAGDELGAMSNAVDRMADECDASFRACQQAQDAVAHTVAEIERLAAQVRAGVLDGQADQTGVSGRYADVLTGVEGVLAAVAGPLSNARTVLDAVAARDLEQRMDGEYHGEFARVQQALNTAVQQLADTVGQVRVAARQVDEAATQLASGSQDLASGSSEQAASADHIGAALAELTQVADRSVQQAVVVKESAERTKASVQRGTEAMQALEVDMQRIKQSADATQRIVRTIDEIAFQTNLLALNAAVEAARAGDAGRGFAVVAEEVRALAIRSAEAAKQTAALIDEEIQNVHGGVQREQAVREQLQAAREQVEHMTITIDEIVSASRQQSAGMADVAKGVSVMSSVTQQVASNAEEGAASAEELQGQASHLAEVVRGFKTRDLESRQPDRMSLSAKRRRVA